MSTPTFAFSPQRRRAIAAAVAFSMGAMAAPAMAKSTVGKPFDKAEFDKALADGKAMAVVFHADWCPTCKTQDGLVAQILTEPRFKDFTLLVADFDNSKELKKQLRVSSQSTFVVFKAGKEVARSTGQTKKEALAETLGKAL